jgi:hypothetical protein
MRMKCGSRLRGRRCRDEVGWGGVVPGEGRVVRLCDVGEVFDLKTI